MNEGGDRAEVLGMELWEVTANPYLLHAGLGLLVVGSLLWSAVQVRIRVEKTRPSGQRTPRGWAGTALRGGLRPVDGTRQADGERRRFRGAAW